LEFVNSDADAAFIGLTREDKHFSFASAMIDAGAGGVELPAIANSALRQFQTKLSPEQLERKLFKLFREARTYEEEQGVNILFVAIGFLHWFEDSRSEERCCAPLLLVPVSLERQKGHDSFVLRGREEDLVANVSLAQRLLKNGITLPEIPEGDEWLPSVYFDAVTVAVAGERRWEVDRAGIGLGFFTFSKFLMWKDLQADSWPEPKELLGHSIIGRLLAKAPATTREEPLVSENEPIDKQIDLASAVHVLDADSSQATCIEEVRQGRNLVIQGPPGTGKSQTITNIIATAVHDGKSVLFVAEKAAALDVVHSRLKRVDLAPLCLEIHSRKATKQSVIASLEGSIRASGGLQFGGKTADELRSARDKLNAWSCTVHREIENTGRTPFQVIGTVLKLKTSQAKTFAKRLDAIRTWDRATIEEAERTVQRAASVFGKLGVSPSNHIWYGAGAKQLNPFDADRLRDAISLLASSAQELLSAGRDAANVLKTDPGQCARDYLTLIQALRILGDLPEGSEGLVAKLEWKTERSRICQLLERGKNLSSIRQELTGRVTEAAWVFDAVATKNTIARHGSSLFRIFIGSYRRAINEFSTLCVGHIPRRLPDRLALLEKLISYQADRLTIETEQEFAQTVFGTFWAIEQTLWDVIEKVVQWTTEASKINSSADLFALSQSFSRPQCSAQADALEKQLGEFKAAFEGVSAIIHPNLEQMFSARTVEEIPIDRAVEKWAKWNEYFEEFNAWVAAREALDQMSALGLGEVAEEVKTGNLSSSDLVPIVHLLIAEALWLRACATDSDLNAIDGSLRTETVERFRELDRKRIQLTRGEVLARYLEGRPNGETGEMGVVRAEIGKKRRHLPIRKLMEQAGTAVQRLKPVFLMSPLSVAQFLPPGRIEFDLVVVDEASQVPPEEALGVLARGRQMVVVGDAKQLPPTNFFKMVADGDDDGQETEETVLGRTRDFESILTLASARGTSERMLKWHYRSKHPSLIALSNKTCYHGRLLLPPSPVLDGENLGISLVKTPPGNYDRGGTGRNLVEADLIAAAVENHLTKWPERSLGLASFSVAQRDALEDALRARGILIQAEAFAPKEERLFIKNLESVQGDERDVIFISIGYGRDAHNQMSQGFGPLSNEGGERRLNVLASRARLQCMVFSSISSGDIAADAKPRGTRMLREFLHYAETRNFGTGEFNDGDYDSPFEEAVAIAIRQAGFQARSQVGVSGFRVDLGVLDPQKPGRFMLGVECDGASYHSGRSARDRDRLRQEILEGLGWNLYRIWSTDWFRNPEHEAKKLFAAIDRARTTPPTEYQTTEPKTQIEEIDENEEPVGTGSAASGPTTRELKHSSAPTQSRDTGPTIPYEEAKLSVPEATNLLSAPKDQLARLVQQVVTREGPIHGEEITRRIRESFGLGRTGRRVLEAVAAALDLCTHQGTIRRDGEFWSAPSAQLKAPRSRRDASVALRRSDRIAPEEYRLAIREVLKINVGATKQELVVSVARLLGFDRLGSDLEDAIASQVGALVGEAQIKDRAGNLSLSQK
jgi:very-short-patch-repair endonuclease